MHGQGRTAINLHHWREKEREVRGYDARTKGRDRWGQDWEVERRLAERDWDNGWARAHETVMFSAHHRSQRTVPRIRKRGFKVLMQNRSRMLIENALDVLCLIEGAILLL